MQILLPALVPTCTPADSCGGTDVPSADVTPRKWVSDGPGTLCYVSCAFYPLPFFLCGLYSPVLSHLVFPEDVPQLLCGTLCAAESRLYLFLFVPLPFLWTHLALTPGGSLPLLDPLPMPSRHQLLAACNCLQWCRRARLQLPAMVPFRRARLQKKKPTYPMAAWPGDWLRSHTREGRVAVTATFLRRSQPPLELRTRHAWIRRWSLRSFTRIAVSPVTFYLVLHPNN
jgi:hypothetical protein